MKANSIDKFGKSFHNPWKDERMDELPKKYQAKTWESIARFTSGGFKAEGEDAKNIFRYLFGKKYSKKQGQ